MNYPPQHYEINPHARPIYSAAPPNVIVAQPSNNQPPIIVNNNQIVQTKTDLAANPQWSTSMFDCFQDLPSCCLGFFCPQCLGCWIAARYNETCCLGWFGPATLVALRTKIRADNKIRGTICDDCICMSFCQQLTLCQMARELNHKGYV
ncbi:cornifelin homolog B-like isoform X2 [Clavelina lepadiformis]|uniref:cornifelin homolog B-like isoform X2 n=1 Tax=Clavelina lepadiformis TaxID=159417 RepID=UPI0040416D3E